jgi:hypothetical protein
MSEKVEVESSGAWFSLYLSIKFGKQIDFSREGI